MSYTISKDEFADSTNAIAAVWKMTLLCLNGVHAKPRILWAVHPVAVWLLSDPLWGGRHPAIGSHPTEKP